MKNTIYLFIFFLSVSCVNISEYYVDAENGNDANSGHTPESVWATLEKVNQTIFQPGDKVLFKAGSSWKRREIAHHAFT